MKMQIALAGLPYEVELKFWLACKLLLSSSLPIQLQKWDGKPCDILVADLDTEEGQVAYEMAVRGNARVLFLSKDTHAEQPAGMRIDKHTTASAIAKTLENLITATPPASSAATKGLLGICLLQGANGRDVLARHGSSTIILHHDSRRLYASSRDELHFAKQQLLDEAWATIPVTAPCEHQYEGLVFENLDSFLVSACHEHRASLPMVDDTSYRLTMWPDFIAFPSHRERLRLASALYRKSWRVGELAEHCAVSLETANAFCWAMQASGALRVADTIEVDNMQPANEPLPFVQRMVRRFGVKARQGT